MGEFPIKDFCSLPPPLLRKLQWTVLIITRDCLGTKKLLKIAYHYNLAHLSFDNMIIDTDYTFKTKPKAQKVFKFNRILSLNLNAQKSQKGLKKELS